MEEHPILDSSENELSQSSGEAFKNPFPVARRKGRRYVPQVPACVWVVLSVEFDSRIVQGLGRGDTEGGLKWKRYSPGTCAVCNKHGPRVKMESGEMTEVRWMGLRKT